MKSRIVVLLIFVTLLWSMMLSRAAFLQLWPNERLQSLQKRQFETVVTLKSRRGDIVDRKGNELAVSSAAYSLFADPKVMENKPAIAKQIAPLIGVSPKEIMSKIKSKTNRFVWLQRKLEPQVREQIENLKIHGLGFIEETRRIYPNESLLAHVLGFVGSDGKGLEGIEAEANETLEGGHTKVSMQRDAHGRPLIVNGQLFHQLPDGSEVQLTIDRDLQYMLERELAETVRVHEANHAVGVILDAQTSEILAMANTPLFDSNNAANVAPNVRRNRAVTDSFEPGSTLKAFTIASALKDGWLEPNTKIDCQGGRMQIGKRVIREAENNDKHRFGMLTSSEILAYSSNVGAAKIAFRLGPEKLRQTLSEFGFGAKTDVDLPGESRGIMRSLPWGELQFSNIAFGQGITVTPLQIANAYAAVANGGWLKRPYIVKRVRDVASGEVVDTQPKTLGHPLNAEQAMKMKLMLMGVTMKDGTGYVARVAGFPVAGKTGTAQKVDPNGRGYIKGGYISSFAGFLPANDPKFVIYIAVDQPRKGYYGTTVAAPVFARIAKFAVRQYGLNPVLFSEEDVIKKPEIRELASRTKVEQDNEKLSKSSSVGGTEQVSVANNASVAAATAIAAGGDHVSSAGVASVVPNLNGLSLREVMLRLQGQGVPLKIHGHGFVSSTRPLPGTTLKDGDELSLYLEPAN